MNADDQSPPANRFANSISARLFRDYGWLIAVVVGGIITFLGLAISRPEKMTAAATCQEGLHQLDQAATFWGEHQPWDKRATAADLRSYFRDGKLPVCESGGTYTFGSPVLATRCSVHGRDAMEPQAYRQPKESTHLFPWSSRPRAARNSCISNLKQIDGAIQQWALEHNKHSEDTINVQDIAPYMKGGALPICPQGGKYDVSTVSANPTCTVRGHTL